MNVWLRRQRYLANYTLAALSRRRTKNIGLVTLYTVIVFVVASAMMFAAALKREAEVKKWSKEKKESLVKRRGRRQS